MLHRYINQRNVTHGISLPTNSPPSNSKMAFKLFVLAAIVAAANAGIIAQAPHSYAAPAPVAYHAAPAAYHAAPAYGYAAPIAKAVVTKTVDPDYDPNPQYSYSYDVHDTLTGDAKSQQETRNGDSVEGSYSLIEADGTRRVVHYTADPHNGFNAVVEKEPASHGPVVAKYAAAPVVAKYAAAPVVAKYAAPLSYAAPINHGYYH